MRKILRSFLINGFSLWLVNQIFSSFYFTKGYETLLVTAFVLGLMNFFVRPLIKILLLPINLLTLGTLRWLVNVFTLYLVTLLVPDFKIIGFGFGGFSYGGISLPSFSFAGIPALILSSLALSFISGLFYWTFK